MKQKPINNADRTPSKHAHHLVSAVQKQRLISAMAACVALLALTLNSTAADYVLNANDGAGTDSFDNSGNWSSGAAPAPGNTYNTGPFSMRTAADSNNHVFKGDSLTLSNAVSAQFPNVSLGLKGNTGTTVTVTNLIMLGGSGIGNISNSGGATDRIAGNISVQGPVTLSDVNSVPRWIGVDSTLSGSGSITNAVLAIYSANNSSFTGPLIAVFSPGGEWGTIIVTNEAAMGGNPASFNAAQLELNRGIFNPQGSFALDHPNAGITIDSGGGIFNVPSGISLTNYEPIAGSGTLSFTNAGTFVDFGTAASFTGTLAINNGTFILGSGASFPAATTIAPGSGATFDVTAAGLSLNSGQTLAGNGTVTGNVTAAAGSKISPGGADNAATLAISGDLTFGGSITLSCDFLTTNDVVAVGGNFSPSGVTTIQLNNSPAVGTYQLFTVAGTLGGSSANFSVSALQTRSLNYAVIYDTASTPKRVLLQVTSGGSAANLIWQGDAVNGVNNVWDINTSHNWLNGLVSDVYFDGDTNNFTDLGATNQPTLNVTVNPGAVFFNSSSNYTLAGTGTIAGQTRLTVGGTGTVTLLLTNNTYSGGTFITNGVLQVGFAVTNGTSPLGVPGGVTPLATVSGTGTLNLNGGAYDSAYTTAVQINGNGFSATQGAIDNTAGGLTSGGGDVGVATLSLAGNSTVSANSNWQIGNTGQGIVGNGFGLTKIGNGYLYLKRAATSPLGGLVISGGGVLFWDHADAAGTTATITLTNGGFIDTWNPATQFGGLTFYNPIVVSDPTNGGMILNIRTPYNHPPSDIYNGIVTLNGTLTVSNNAFVAANQYNNNRDSYGKVTLNGNISGPGGIIIMGNQANYISGTSSPYVGGNVVVLNGNNSYSGPTMVTNFIQLLTSTANQSGGSYDLVDGGLLDVSMAAGKPTLPMSSLILEYQNLPLSGVGGTLGFTRLSSMPTSPVIYATNLTINAGYILPPTAGYSVGQFPLIKYDGTIGGNGFAGLTLGPLPAGVSASLVNNTANHSIDLQVTTAGILWTGANSTNWDTGTVNWFNPVSSSTTTYSDGQTVVFGDNATNYNVSIAQPISPGGVTVNSTNNYVFSTANGGITGSGALIKNGSGTLTVACTNNTFTGGTFITGGTLKLADLNYAYPYGGGALNNNLGTVTIANGGTLDINGVEVPNYQSYGPDGYNVFLSGVGVGGLGALVNNNTNDNDVADPGYVTLTGDATVGGPGDINIRMGVSPQLASQSSAYTLTKVGSGQFRLRYVATVSTNFGPINILGGIVSYESSSALGLGDPTKPIMIGSGAGFAWGTTNARCARPLICSNNSTLYGYNITNNVFTSPVTLDSGNVNLNANFYHGMIFSNVLSGAGGITLQYQSLATFAAANTYSGPTVVANCNTTGGGFTGSVLKLIGNGSINNSASITLQGITASQSLAGALDVSGRSDGTLTLVNGQTLRGDNGSYVKGSVVASSGTTIAPGGAANVQYMSVSNNLTLQAGSTVAMDVSLDGGVTNDQIRVTGTTTYGGTLQIARTGATALTVGAQFKLFSSGGYSGNFASVTGTTGETWTFDPATGIATVASVPSQTGPVITHVGLSGTTLTINATGGSVNGQFVLLQSTNLALPLAQWTPVLTNVFDGSGNLNLSTNIVSTGVAREFYILSE